MDPIHRRISVADPAQRENRLSPAHERRFEGALAEILQALGLDLAEEGTRDTPARMLDALIESTSGYEPDPNLATTFPCERLEPEHGIHAQVVEGPISFTALCEHHALPFFGTAWVGYVAADRLIGLSKLTRVVRQYSRRFTMQERLGRDIAAGLQVIVEGQGVAVRLDAVHLCARMRGVRECEALTHSTLWTGCYERQSSLRQEFLALCNPR